MACTARCTCVVYNDASLHHNRAFTSTCVCVPVMRFVRPRGLGPILEFLIPPSMAEIHSPIGSFSNNNNSTAAAISFCMMHTAKRHRRGSLIWKWCRIIASTPPHVIAAQSMISQWPWMRLVVLHRHRYFALHCDTAGLSGFHIYTHIIFIILLFHSVSDFHSITKPIISPTSLWLPSKGVYCIGTLINIVFCINTIAHTQSPNYVGLTFESSGIFTNSLNYCPLYEHINIHC